MQIVIADTGPLNYLILIDAIELVPQLFTTVLVPEAVRAELADPDAPAKTRAWIEKPPSWLIVKTVPAAAKADPLWRTLDDGEAEALALARQLAADLILIDERAGVAIATQQGFAVTGTIGILTRAAEAGLVDLADAFARLRATTFRYPPQLLDALLTKFRKS